MREREGEELDKSSKLCYKKEKRCEGLIGREKMGSRGDFVKMRKVTDICMLLRWREWRERKR